jgi:hypothetical protein
VGIPPVEIATLSQRSNLQEAKAKFITLPLWEQILQFQAIERSTSEIIFNQQNMSLMMTQTCTIQQATLTP